MKYEKILIVVLGSIQVITAIGAIPAGIGYLVDISGAKMGVSADLLKDSPLDTFLLPGLFLLLINGLATAAGSVMTFIKHRYAGIAAALLGVALVLWIIIQVWWIGLISFLQPVFFIAGISEALLGLQLIKLTKS